MKKICFKCPVCGVSIINFDIGNKEYRESAITHIEGHIPYNQRITKPKNSKSPTYRSYQRYIKKLKDLYGDNLRLIGKNDEMKTTQYTSILWKRME